MVAAAGASKTEWRTDANAHTILRVGVRPSEYLSFFFLGRLGYGTVDERMLTLVSLGAQVWPLGQLELVSPYARVALAHQHEESLVVVRDDPIGALFGIGDGIRHRGGLEGAVGIDVPFFADDEFEVFGSVEATTIWFYDPRGPHWYVGGNMGLGVSYAL